MQNGLHQLSQKSDRLQADLGGVLRDGRRQRDEVSRQCREYRRRWTKLRQDWNATPPVGEAPPLSGGRSRRLDGEGGRAERQESDEEEGEEEREGEKGESGGKRVTLQGERLSLFTEDFLRLKLDMEGGILIRPDSGVPLYQEAIRVKDSLRDIIEKRNALGDKILFGMQSKVTYFTRPSRSYCASDKVRLLRHLCHFEEERDRLAKLWWALLPCHECAM